MDNKQGSGQVRPQQAMRAVLANEFSFANRLSSQARQSAAERAWSAISRFYDNYTDISRVRGDLDPVSS